MYNIYIHIDTGMYASNQSLVDSSVSEKELHGRMAIITPTPKCSSAHMLRLVDSLQFMFLDTFTVS